MPRFARGFVLAAHAVDTPVDGWRREDVLGLVGVLAPEVVVTRATFGSADVVVLGHLVDTAGWLPRDQAVAAAAAALDASEAAFLDCTDAWCGRYLVVSRSAARGRAVMTDASAMRSAFYALEGPFTLASHARLVADIVDAPGSSIIGAWQETKAAVGGLALALPGRTTPWTGVVQLTANMALDVERRCLRRIYPRASLPAMDVRAAAAAIGPRLRGQVEALVATGRPVVISATAGRDSRVSVAASRPHRDAIRYFTYVRKGHAGSAWDAAIAGAMAAGTGLRHQVLDVLESDVSPELDEALRDATTVAHNRALVGTYRRTFRPDTMHIRSNLGEIGRSMYRRTRAVTGAVASGRPLTPEDVARVWASGLAVEPAVVDAFADWMDAVGFRDVAGLDPFDLLHWEHRMASWHSSVVLESDFAFDTHVLFNARTILGNMLAVPVEDRLRSAVFRQIVEDLWPELLRWPYEPPPRRTLVGSARARVHKVRRRLGAAIAG